MPDDYIDLENRPTDEQKPVDETEEAEDPSSGSSRLAFLPAILVFGLLLLLFRGNPWRWYIAISGGYTILVFIVAFGTALKDTDDFFGNPEALRYALKLLVPHLPVLILINAGIYEWFHLKPSLPDWLTHKSRKGSLWEMLGWLALVFAGIWQGSWMGGMVKRRLAESEER